MNNFTNCQNLRLLPFYPSLNKDVLCRDKLRPHQTPGQTQFLWQFRSFWTDIYKWNFYALDGSANSVWERVSSQEPLKIPLQILVINIYIRKILVGCLSQSRVSVAMLTNKMLGPTFPPSCCIKITRCCELAVHAWDIGESIMRRNQFFPRTLNINFVPLHVINTISSYYAELPVFVANMFTHRHNIYLNCWPRQVTVAMIMHGLCSLQVLATRFQQ